MDKKVKDSLGLLLLAPLLIAIGLAIWLTDRSNQLGLATWIAGVGIAVWSLARIGLHLSAEANRPDDAPRPQ